MSALAFEERVAEIAVGDVVAERTVHLTRESLVRYAGASGDFNPIHYRDDVAAHQAGIRQLPGHRLGAFDDARQAVLLREILGPPKALQSGADAPL